MSPGDVSVTVVVKESSGLARVPVKEMVPARPADERVRHSAAIFRLMIRPLSGGGIGNVYSNHASHLACRRLNRSRLQLNDFGGLSGCTFGKTVGWPPSRVAQMTALLNLAPNIQEEILFLPAAEALQLRISEPSLRKLTATLLWIQQREHWKNLRRSAR
jgi:hypothetical protein